MIYKNEKEKEIEIIEILTDFFNYDISIIILKKMYFLNHTDKFNYCLNQIKNTENQYTKFINNPLKEPWRFSEYILVKNRQKIAIKYRYIKKDIKYQLVY